MTSTSPSTSTQTTSSDPNSGIAGSSNGADTDAGASGGSSNSFNLSKGGLAAIIVVVALVVIVGVATTTLFIIAKRRQWNIRASIRRASRRFTGRGPPRNSIDRRSKRAGFQLDSTPASRGHKRGLMVEVKDVEKGQGGSVGGGGDVQKPKGAMDAEGWKGRLWRNDWKR
ncbi:hypothetical protein M409DRAFT_18535 [Zasmidium cellare ATCC 36951]|uniref:Uncharacterized protein n=1 Tax=Zasmidium cellare ATCC 36951 TaxID=1080233 RepID=A0A6A6CZ26_ZASCE|nr:uncharacterized protein M409DRAFT_18535 [Zasmidium cellare ATCC 36951]KAF2171418.1 hypothetical protein M409DRAFT_18535 [Zasmidium cellare ATCC 36951]